MSLKYISKILIFTELIFCCLTAAQCEKVKTHPDTEPYVKFLDNDHLTAKAYILSLFQENDIVILCERDHREITQYNLIADLLSDPWFIDNVGVVYTEVGARQLNAPVAGFLRSEGLTDAEIDASVLAFQRDCHYPIWEKTNYANFLKSIHSINSKLSSDKKIEVVQTDIFYPQEITSSEKLAQLRTQEAVRDSLMGTMIVQDFGERIIRKPDQKALVIMNFRHALTQPIVIEQIGLRRDNAGQFIATAAPGRVANVMLNTTRLAMAVSDQEVYLTLINDGKWDAAFRAANVTDVGFDFADSPFGADNFDFTPFEMDERYQDFFTGFVFYEPLENFRIANGLPGFMEDGYYDTFYERYKIIEPGLEYDKESMMYLNTTEIIQPEEYRELEPLIAKWLE